MSGATSTSIYKMYQAELKTSDAIVWKISSSITTKLLFCREADVLLRPETRSAFFANSFQIQQRNKT